MLVVVMDKHTYRGDLIFCLHSSPVCYVFILLLLMANRRWLSTIKLHADGNITCKTHWLSLNFTARFDDDPVIYLLRCLVWGFCYEEHEDCIVPSCP
jgi:hypothetical protein